MNEQKINIGVNEALRNLVTVNQEFINRMHVILTELRGPTPSVDRPNVPSDSSVMGMLGRMADQSMELSDLISQLDRVMGSGLNPSISNGTTIPASSGIGFKQIFSR